MEQKNKRGVLGLNITTAFVTGLLVLGIIGVVSVIVVGSVTDVEITGNTITRNGGDFGNQTVNLTDVGLLPSGVTDVTDARGSTIISYTNLVLKNASSQQTLATGNFTTNSTGAFFPTTGHWNATGGTSGLNVNISGSFSYTKNSFGKEIGGNISEGFVTLFDSAVTWFALLAIVILILIIVTVIVVIKGISNKGGGL